MIIRRRIDHGYTVMPRAALEDTRLSYEARGLLGYLLAKPNDWRVNVTDLCRKAGPKPCGRDRIYRILDELKAVGYVVFGQARDKDGRMLAGEYIVTDAPATTEPEASETPQSENPDTAEPDAAEPDTENPDAYKDLTPTDSEVDQTSLAPVGAEAPPSAPEPAPKPKAQRPRRPMFDAIMEAWPDASVKVAGTFDSECTKKGLTVDRWHAFMAVPKSRNDYAEGFLTPGNAFRRFFAWSQTARRDPARAREDDPLGLALKARNDAYLKAKGWA